MIKIYDCSNSNGRPTHRGGRGPKENDIIRYLKEYCHKYNCIFVNNANESDIIITNDVFPDNLPDRPKIKRMDGIFWQYDLLSRNIPLNNAAIKADHVIFISKFSRDSYFNLYGHPLKKYSVVLNQADPKTFYNRKNNNKEFSLVTTASSWSRSEKRFNAILELAKNIKEKIYVIGEPVDINIPNIIFIGYLDTPEKIAEELNNHSAFINYSYRDAITKTIGQALCCNLPICYSNSGGVHEAVENYGYGISDIVKSNFEGKVPDLNTNDIINGYNIFLNNFNIYKEKLLTRNHDLLFNNMLKGYFDVIKSFVNNNKKN